MTTPSHTQAKLMAQAVYEIRLLLADYRDDEVACDPAVRQAAHLAYALHNEALAVVSGDTFDVAAVLERLAAIDELFGSQFHAGFTEVLGGGE